MAQIHTTRLEMLGAGAGVGGSGGHSVIDVACHQGYFASHLAEGDGRCTDARPQHVADTIARAYGLANLRAAQYELKHIAVEDLGQFDITLMLDHVENPVGAIRLAARSPGRSA